MELISFEHEEVIGDGINHIEVQRIPGRFFVTDRSSDWHFARRSRENVHKRRDHGGRSGQSREGLGSRRLFVGRGHNVVGHRLERVGDFGSKVIIPGGMVKVGFFRGRAAHFGSLDLPADHVAHQVAMPLDEAKVIVRALIHAVRKAVESVQIQLTLKGWVFGLRKESGM